MLTFDDGTISQYVNALPELKKYNFTTTFFIMTVTLDRPGYLSRKQIKELSAQGYTISCHTWNHHDVRSYKEADWEQQLVKPTILLNKITGQPIKYFAYPYGLWNINAASHIRKLGYILAFQLSGQQNIDEPMYTVIRIIVDGHWTSKQLDRAIKNSFK